jgi:hyperosmotically inducible periplasmic protein
MGRALNVVAVGLVVLAFVVGCQSLTRGNAAISVDDASVTAAVKTKLVVDRSANLTRIDVDTNRGTVYLTGSVDTTEQKARAEKMASRATGVKGVVNNLQVVQKR